MRRPRSTDAELVRRAAEGDLSAFDALVRRHRSRAYDLARRITGDAEAAHDVVQDAFLNAFRSLGALRDSHRFGQWLNTIVRRESIHSLRAGTHRPEAREPAVLSLIGSAAGLPAEPPGEVHASIREALAVLSARHRRVMILHYLGGYTCAEIARRLGLSTGGIKRILHTSRNTVREECRTMAENARKGPGRLSFWISGEVPHGEWDAVAQLRAALAQAICLSVNKRAKNVEQIAEEVEAHPDYVGDTVSALTKLEVLASPTKGRFLLSFVALDLADWRRLFSDIRQPGAEIASRLSESQDVLRTAFGKTPLAGAGWTWEDVTWVVNCLIIAQRRLARAAGHPKVLHPPARPGGYPYWLGGLEYRLGSGVSLPDTPGWCGTDRGGWGIGHFGPSMEHRGHTWVFDPPAYGRSVLHVLLEGPFTEEAILSRLSAEDRERYQSTLAKLVAAGLLERREDATFGLSFPVFTEGDSDVLTPVVDTVVEPIIREVVTPATNHLDSLLDEMGYGFRRDQYPVWRDWCSAFIMGEALRFMVKQGALPDLGDQPPARWSYAAWRGDLRLFSFS